MSLPIIKNDIQDRNTAAWKQLCRYIDQLAEEGGDEFSPQEALGPELFSKIYTLPESIAKLKKVRKLWLYGSQLKRIPPEIGAMESLEYFDPYTSYDLHWFPYEITYCKNLKDSRVSTRALYGNFKNRMPFPDLIHNPVRYEGQIVKCSVCRKEMSYMETYQLWISLRVGTDVLPLLTNLCSKECAVNLPQPEEGYLQYAHNGGTGLKQPLTYEELWEQYRKHRQENKQHSGQEEHQKGSSIIVLSLTQDLKRFKESERIDLERSGQEEKQKETTDAPPSTKLQLDLKELKPLKLVRKIWEK